MGIIAEKEFLGFGKIAVGKTGASSEPVFPNKKPLFLEVLFFIDGIPDNAKAFTGMTKSVLVFEV